MTSARIPLEHDRLVQLIYDCADDPRGFHDALEEIGHQLGAEKGHTLLIQLGVERAENHSYGYDASSFKRYDEDWRDKDPRFAAALRAPGQILSDVAVVDSAAFERSAIYNEHLVQADVRYTLFASVVNGPDLMTAQAFMRCKGAGSFGAAEITRLERLLPHICRAARLRHLVGSMRGEIDDLRRALDAAPAAMALLDSSGKVLCANAAAKEILDERDGLRIERSTLTSSRMDEARALSAAIAQTASLADAGAWRPPSAQLTPSVAISRENKAPVAVVLFALRPRNGLREGGPRSARVLAVLHDPERQLRLNPALIAQLHGLTPTEAMLAAAIAGGRTLAEFAAERGCTEQTARSHLKRVLGKTGTKRQADLVRVLLTGAANHHIQ